MDPNAIKRQVESRPRTISAVDIRRFGDVSRLKIFYIKTKGQYFSIIPFLIDKGHNFGYINDEMPIDYDINNMLNILIEQINNKDAVTRQTLINDLKIELLDVYVWSAPSSKQIYGKDLGPGHFPGQVILRLHEALNLLSAPVDFFLFARSAIWNKHNNTLQRLFELSNIPVNSFFSRVRVPPQPGLSDILVEDDNEMHPRLLHEALYHKNYEAIRFLINRGANPHLKDRGRLVFERSLSRSHYTPPKTAAELAKGDSEALKALKLMPIMHPNSVVWRSRVIQANPNSSELGVQSIAEIANKQALVRRSHLLTLRNNAGGGKKRKRQTRRRNLKTFEKRN